MGKTGVMGSGCVTHQNMVPPTIAIGKAISAVIASITRLLCTINETPAQFHLDFPAAWLWAFRRWRPKCQIVVVLLPRQR